jgi:hypothetical protein
MTAASAVTAGDMLTVLTTVDQDKLATKVIAREAGQWHIRPYGSATWFSVRQVPVADVIQLGQVLRSLEGADKSFVIRGEPLSTTDLTRCRRLLYPHVTDDGEVFDPTFEVASRRWLAIDFDSLPTPRWDPEHLARRRAVILRDRAERPTRPPKGAEDGEDYCHEDLDPAPIDPVKDWPLIIRAAVATLPPQFADAHAWWQMTSSAGIKPGVRLRLWFWLAAAITDEQAKIWLQDSHVDPSIYRPVQPTYTAAPIFDPPELNPVAERSGMWWRHVGEVPVPEIKLPVREPIEVAVQHQLSSDQELTAIQRRARGYADACLRSAEQAPPGDRHPALRSAAITCFGLAEHGFIDRFEVMGELLAITSRLQWGERRATDLIAWCAAFAAAKRPLPRGFP